MKTRDQLKSLERHLIEELEFHILDKQDDVSAKIELSTTYFKAGLFFDALDLLDEIDNKHFSQEAYRLRTYFMNALLFILDPDNEHLHDDELRQTLRDIYPVVQQNIAGGFFTDARQANALYKVFARNYYVDFAYYFLRRAAQLGYPSAQVDLALEYYHGGLFPKNHALAFAWTKKAADTGDSVGLNNLGNFYYEGIGTKINYELAFKYMHEAMLKGETVSCTELGYLYYHGLGIEKDIDKAIDIWEKGAALNNLECIKYLNQYVSID